MPKKVMFLKTETDGLHQTKPWEKVSTKNLWAHAHLIKLSYHKCEYKNGKLKLLDKVNTLIKPEHFYVAPEIEKYNGLTQEKLEKKGKKLVDVMEKLKKDLKGCHVIVGHNLPFHLKTLQASCFYSAVDIQFRDYTLVDLMDFNHKLEYPSLKKLSEYCFGDEYRDKEKSFNMILIKKIFLHLYKKLEEEVKNS